jgi:hypothetical protein
VASGKRDPRQAAVNHPPYWHAVLKESDMASEEVEKLSKGLGESVLHGAYRVGFLAIRLNWSARNVAARLAFFEQKHPPEITQQFLRGMLDARQREA